MSGNAERGVAGGLSIIKWQRLTFYHAYRQMDRNHARWLNAAKRSVPTRYGISESAAIGNARRRVGRGNSQCQMGRRRTRSLLVKRQAASRSFK